MKKRTRILIVAFVSIIIIIPTFYLRINFNEWFYKKIIRFIPRVVWLPLDTIFALAWYIILAVCFYWFWEEHAEKRKNEKNS